MHCCIPTPTTDNNTSTGVIWATLHMGRSAANHPGNVMELSRNFILSGEWSPCIVLIVIIIIKYWESVHVARVHVVQVVNIEQCSVAADPRTKPTDGLWGHSKICPHHTRHFLLLVILKDLVNYPWQFTNDSCTLEVTLLLLLLSLALCGGVVRKFVCVFICLSVANAYWSGNVLAGPAAQ